MSSMTPVSSLAPGVAQAAGVRETSKIQRTGNETLERPRKPVMDEYIPEEKREASGLYWMGKGENGRPTVYFDDPERTADSAPRPEKRPGASSPEGDKAPEASEKKAPEKKAERCAGNTDQVDREIERLKRKREELERQISAEPDESKVKSLKRKLAQVERELNQKDNDTYRRQHTVFS